MQCSNLLIVLLIIGLIAGNAECRKRTGSSSSSRSRPASRTTSRPRTTTSHHDNVNPSKIGWNVPDTGSHNRPNSGNVGPKPSAPLPDQHLATKVNAPSSQSGYPGQSNHNPYQQSGTGYNPSVGQQYHPPNNNPSSYNPAVGSPYGQSYNPPVGGHSYHPSGAGQPYNPSYGQPPSYGHQPSYGQPPSYGQQPSYHQPMGQPYTPTVGQPYHQQAGQPYNPPVQTVILAPAQAAGSSNRGIGQIAKEAVVFAGVSAGVNAAVNRLLPGGIRGSSGGGGGNTQITYNNYYNNGTTDSQGNPMPQAPAANGAVIPPAGNPANPMTATGDTAPVNPANSANPTNPTNPVQDNSATPSSVIPLNAEVKPTADLNAPSAQSSGNPMAPPEQTNLVSNEELAKLTEELFNADTHNSFKYITLKLQGQKTDDSVTDSASEPLLTVDPEALKIPTIAALRSISEKYEMDFKEAEKTTAERRAEETELINTFASTEVMKKALKFLSDKGLIPNDEFEFKDALKRIWFSQYALENNVLSSSGFESVFLAEKIRDQVVGLRNWVYFNYQETAGKANYLGYIKETKLGTNAAIVKVRATLNDIVIPVTTVFVGTSPELEMALYTICYYVRPNGVCPITLGATPFNIFTYKIIYFGKEILFGAYPEI